MIGLVQKEDRREEESEKWLKRSKEKKNQKAKEERASFPGFRPYIRTRTAPSSWWQVDTSKSGALRCSSVKSGAGSAEVADQHGQREPSGPRRQCGAAAKATRDGRCRAGGQRGGLQSRQKSAAEERSRRAAGPLPSPIPPCGAGDVPPERCKVQYGRWPCSGAVAVACKPRPQAQSPSV